MQPTANLRIVFMGTPEFAVPSLDALVKAGFNIAGVITAPDKPAGRGLKISISAIKEYALSQQLPILQPANLKDPAFIEALQLWKADLQVVVAFRMLPEVVWNMPPMGTINLHGSLLPQYRGAAPINWAVINGEKITGATTFKLQHEIDTGAILLQESFPITADDNAGTVHDRMSLMGARLLVKTVTALANNTIEAQPQSFPEGAVLRSAPKINAATCKIEWNNSVEAVYNLIRGLSPYPGAFTTLQEKTFKIYAATFESAPPTIAAGSWEIDASNRLRFACEDGYIYPELIQAEGKKRMPVADFLRGFRA